jgi:hypothetical protein
MALIIRVDVDRPYGKHPLTRHVLSKLGSDYFFPKVEPLGYLKELKVMLRLLNEAQARAYVFFRQCTLPSASVIELLEAGRHEIGLHLENSRSFSTFSKEKQLLEHHIGKPTVALSKHGSGVFKYGRHHYAPYEAEKYIAWAQEAKMRVFFGNLEDPSCEPVTNGHSFAWFPAAFWLEPHWRNTDRFPVDWLTTQARKRDVVLLVHPDNVLESAELTRSFTHLLRVLETRILS